MTGDCVWLNFLSVNHLTASSHMVLKEWNDCNKLKRLTFWRKRAKMWWCKGGIQFIYSFRFCLCSTRAPWGKKKKIRAWISLSYPSVSSASKAKSSFLPPNLTPEHLPHKSAHPIFQQNNTSGDNLTHQFQEKRKEHSVWLSFHPKTMLKKVIMPFVLLLTLCAGGWAERNSCISNTCSSSSSSSRRRRNR